MGTSSFNPQQSHEARARTDAETEFEQGEVTCPKSQHHKQMDSKLCREPLCHVASLRQLLSEEVFLFFTKNFISFRPVH